MNLSSLKLSVEAMSETMDNGHTGDSVIDSLLDEVWLMIFRFLSEDQLLIVERVCVRWKAIVDTCFATTRRLRMCGYGEMGLSGYKALQRMRRYGPALKSLSLSSCNDTYDHIDWIAEIGDSFPNLSSLSLSTMRIKKESLRVLPMKCCKITSISLHVRYLSDADIGIVLKGLPGLKCLKLDDYQDLFGDITTIGECFRELGTNVEYLKLTTFRISPAGARHIFSRCTKIQTLKIDHRFQCDARDFNNFCEKSPLRKLRVDGSDCESQVPKEVFLPISHLSLLEKLDLNNCEEVDSDVLIGISHGCPNLKRVFLNNLPLVCDRGVKCFAKCTRLTDLECCSLKMVSDETLFEFARAGILESLSIADVAIFGSRYSITDSGLSAILTQCPKLTYLSVNYCDGVGDGTVDAAIAAVESRQLLSATDSESPHGKSNALVPHNKAVKNSGYLLCLYIRMSGVEGFNRYKSGFSHPLLDLYVD